MRFELRFRIWLVTAIGMLAACLSCLPVSAATRNPDATLIVGTLKAEIYQGAGTPMIFVPSLGAGPWIWEGLDQRFAHDHPVYTLTLAGLDGRPSASAPVIDKVVDDLARLIAQRHLEHPILVGHSLGGFIAFRFAEAHPDMIGGLVAAEGFPVFPPLADKDIETRRKAAQKLADNLAGDKTPQAFRASMLTFLEARMNDPVKASGFADLASRSDPDAVAEYVREMLSADLRPDLVKLKVPVLAIAAMNSYKDGSSESDIRAFYEHLLANTAHLHVVVVPHARHFVMVDQPEAVATAIGAFLKDSDETSDAAQIRSMLTKRFERPDAHLAIPLVTIEDDAAVVDWMQGGTGGRALLERRQGQWSVVLCGGDGLKSADTLVQAGLAPMQAHTLADHLAQAERALAPSILAGLRQFGGVVQMESKK